MKNVMDVKGKKNIGTLIISLIITLGTGYLSSVFTRNAMNLYKELKKPVFSPPSWVFPIAWTILFILMGISLYRIIMLKKEGEDVTKALVFFAIQLILNFIWPILFFKLRLIGLAFMEIVLLIIFIMLTMVNFYKKDKIAGYLLIPYLLWVIFAAVLNFYIFMLNDI